MAEKKVAVKVKAAAEKAKGAVERATHEPFRLPKRVEDFLEDPFPAIMRAKPWVERHWAFAPWALRHWSLEDGNWLTPIDVVQEKGAVVIKADLPGLKAEEIEVTVQGNSLVIKGHRQESKESKKKDYYLSERTEGTFQRTVSIPEGVDPVGVTASYKDGVLEVQIPTTGKQPAAQTKVKVAAK